MSFSRLILIGSFLFSFAAAHMLQAQAQTDPQVQQLIKNNGSAGIPFQYFNGHIFVTLSVNGKPGMSFLFDTGTSASILNITTSQRLGLKPESIRKEKDLGLGGGKVATAAAKDVDVKLGNITVANTLALVDLRGLEQVNGHRMDGILGFPVLEHFIAELDFENQTLTLRPAKGYKYHGNGEVLTLSRKKYPAAIPVILGTLNHGRHDAMVEVDTGNDATLLLYSRFAQRAHLLKDTRKPQNELVYGIGGFVPIQVATLNYMTLGDTAVSPLTVFFMQSSPRASEKRDLSGAVGMAILAKYRRIIFDVPKRRIILEHPQLPNYREIGQLTR